MRDIKVLSTKKLTLSQREIILNTNIDVVEYNAISIEKRSFTNKVVVDNAIVTSQNTARMLIKSKAKICNVFCVGEKTALLLVENGYNIVEVSKNASDLAAFIVKNYKNEPVVFFCGDKRRNELPDALSQNKISFTEEILYNTTLNFQKFEEDFKAVLFYSPSGVQSYTQVNSLKNIMAFCIGSTTANEAIKYTSEIVIAAQTTIESVVDEVVCYFKV